MIDTDAIYNSVRSIVIETLSSDAERGGPMQRQYPTAIIESMADSIAGRVVDALDEQ